MTEQLRPTLEHDDSEAFKEKVRRRQAAKAARALLVRHHPDNLDLPASRLYHVQPQEAPLEGNPADAKLAGLQEHPNDRDTTPDPLDIFHALDTPNAHD